MEPWKKFLMKTKLDKELLGTYFKLRKLFQKLEWTNDDLSSPPSYPRSLMGLRDMFKLERDQLVKSLKDYGFKVDPDSFSIYLRDQMRKIDELTPLKDVNNKRGNQRDEDS